MVGLEIRVFESDAKTTPALIRAIEPEVDRWPETKARDRP